MTATLPARDERAKPVRRPPRTPQNWSYDPLTRTLTITQVVSGRPVVETLYLTRYLGRVVMFGRGRTLVVNRAGCNCRFVDGCQHLAIALAEGWL
jgi:hypothetical protein